MWSPLIKGRAHGVIAESGARGPHDLRNTQFENLTSAFMEPPMWRPNLDGYVFPHTYGKALRLNAHSDIPILTGNKDESGVSSDTS